MFAGWQDVLAALKADHRDTHISTIRVRGFTNGPVTPHGETVIVTLEIECSARQRREKKSGSKDGYEEQTDGEHDKDHDAAGPAKAVALALQGQLENPKSALLSGEVTKQCLQGSHVEVLEDGGHLPRRARGKKGAEDSEGHSEQLVGSSGSDPHPDADAHVIVVAEEDPTEVQRDDDHSPLSAPPV